MKILLICEFFPVGKDLKFSGGVEARTFFVAKYLAKKHKVTVLTSRLYQTSKEEKKLGFKIVRVGKQRDYKATAGNIINRIRFIFSSIKEAQKYQADIVEGTNFVTHFVAKRISVRKKIPVVFWYPDVWTGSWINNVGLIGIFGEVLERINIFFKANAYIAISKTTADKLKNKVRGKIRIIYCGVDPAEFNLKPKKFDTPTIISVSRLAKYKNLRTIILAFALLAKRIQKINLLIIGNGPQKSSLLALTKNLKIENKVKIYSNVSRKELVRLYKSSHIFSLPSKVEGFGIVTIEAAQCGLPYVNSNLEIQKEITKNSKGGFLVNPDSPLMFAQKFERLLNDNNLYLRKSQEAKKLAQNYRWDQISRQTELVYESLI